MTDHGAEQPHERFSWLRDILKVRRQPPPTRLRADPRRTLRTQVGIIRQGFDGDVAVAKGASRDDADVEFLYRPGVVLVASGDVDALQSFLSESDRYDGGGEAVSSLLDGLSLLHLPPRADTGAVDVLGTLEHIDNELREGLATPDHVLYVVPKPGVLCPATEPELPPSKSPVPACNPNDKAGHGIRVSVVDTGWWPPAAAHADTTWLKVDVEGDVEQIDTTDIDSYAGHGTFVAGVLRCMAPATAIEIEGALTQGGAVYESDIVHQLNEAMVDGDDPELISISAGTHSRKSLPLKSFEVLATVEKFVEGDRAVLVVAAAGNDGSSDPFWPAAFDWVLSVGSLDATGRMSTFSNYGPWVDVYAHGDKLVNAFPSGTYVCKEDGVVGVVRKFSGLAQWSGTSFATPIVTGLIAAFMSENGVSARRARDALLDAALPQRDDRVGRLKSIGPPFVR